MASQETPTDKKQEGNTALGCGCLIVIVLLIGWLATSCLGGSDEPDTQALPAVAPPTTTSSAPPTTFASPSSSYASPPAQPVASRDCADFGSQAAAQAALLPGDPGQLDPDSDGLACENYFARQNQPDTYVPAPRVPSNNDDNSGTRPRSGNSGHPCGPGERDGDGDGYCGEG